jgi:3',5'-cyclic AMP phosphodiesterase CpdA
MAFRLAHLSDIHLAPAEGVTMRFVHPKRALGAANWQRNRAHVHQKPVLDRIVADLQAQMPDHIVVTGDLVNLGLPAEHEAALRWLEALGGPQRVTVVPGNHDAYVKLRRDTGHRRWQDYMAANKDGVAFGGGADAGFPFVRVLGSVAIVGLASGQPTPPFVSSGRLGDLQRRQLRTIQGRLREAGLVRVVLLHHPPYRYRMAWRTGLRDAAGLEQVLREEGADLVLHGHFHRHLLQWVNGAAGPVPLVGVPSASAAVRHHGDLAGYNLYSIEPGASPLVEVASRGIEIAEGPVVETRRWVLAP